MSWEKNISVIKKSLRYTTRRKDEWTLARNAFPSPSSSPPETCLDSQSRFGWTTLSPIASHSRAWMTLLWLPIALNMLPSMEWDRGQSFPILDGFLKCISVQPVGRGLLKPSYWREVNISPILDPATGRVEWMGGEGMKPHQSLLLNHRWWESCWLQGQANRVFVLLWFMQPVN